MSDLYATIDGDGRAGQRTRQADTWTRVSAQSWDGSVSVQLQVDGSFIIEIGEGSTTTGTTVAKGNVQGKHITIV